jgi:hypothetical protein
LAAPYSPVYDKRKAPYQGSEDRDRQIELGVKNDDLRG